MRPAGPPVPLGGASGRAASGASEPPPQQQHAPLPVSYGAGGASDPLGAAAAPSRGAASAGRAPAPPQQWQQPQSQHRHHALQQQPPSGSSAASGSAVTTASHYTSAAASSGGPPSGGSAGPGSSATGAAPAGGSAAWGPPSGGSSSAATASSAATYAFGARPGAPQLSPPPPQSFASEAGAAAAAAAPAAPERVRLGPGLEASCPLLCIARADENGSPDAIPLPISNLQFDALVYVSQAFVKVQLLAQYPPVNGYEDRPLWLFLPKTAEAVVTDVAVENIGRGAVFTVAVVPKEDTARFGAYGGSYGGSFAGGAAPGGGGGSFAAGGGGGGGQGEPEAAARDPELFALPLSPGVPGDKFRVTLSYLQPLEFEEGRYSLALPTTVPPACIPEGLSVNGILDVTVAVNSGAPGPVEWRAGSHPAAAMEARQGSVALALDREQPWDNTDFWVDYGVWRRDLTATLHVAPAPAALAAAEGDAAVATAAADPRGSFCLMVSPPGPECSTPFCRSIVFMFDRSGSMEGEPLAYAKGALAAGLASLRPGDQFAVVAFDHEQLWWTELLCDATPENLAACAQWVSESVRARGTTDIMGPLQRAVRILQLPPSRGGPRGLPFIFLLTDGCVENEREICRYIESVTTGGGGAGPPLITATATAPSAYEDASSGAFPTSSVGLSGGLAGSGAALSASNGALSSALPPAANGPPSSAAASSAVGAAAAPQSGDSFGAYSSLAGGSADGGSAYGGSYGGPAARPPAGPSGAAAAPPPPPGSSQPASSYLTAPPAPLSLTARPAAGGPRIFTLGIGPYCNHYFLKQLAALGRGLSGSALRPRHVRGQMERMLAAAAAPLLSDVMLLVQGVPSCELFPPVLPDVYCGQPLLVVGKYDGEWPAEAQLRGTLPTGEEYVQSMPSLPMGPLPVDTLFAKGRLDLLVARAWLEGGPPDLIRKIIDLSVASGVTTPHTAMVGFETSSWRFKKLRALPPSERRKLITRWAIGGAAGVGVVAGAALALAFGSLAATAANAPVEAAMAAAGVVDFSAFAGGGCECCGAACEGGQACGDMCAMC